MVKTQSILVVTEVFRLNEVGMNELELEFLEKMKTLS
jgi:hypothetical protein